MKEIKFKTSTPSTTPAPLPPQTPLPSEPTANPTAPDPAPPEQNPQPDPQINDDSNLFISEDDFYKQYEGDKKIAADAVEDPETGEITVTPVADPVATKQPVTEAEAMKNARILMNMREGLQAFGLSFYVEGNVQDYERYKYPPAQFNRLVDAYAPLIQKANIRVPAGLDVITAELTCTGPLLALAYKSREQRIQLQRAAAIISAQNKKIEHYEKQESFNKPTRSPDSQKKWQISNKGFFTHTASGVYLKQHEQNERPNLQRDYKLLIKHNDKAFIDKTFNIKGES